MADLRPFYENLGNLQNQTRKLNSVGLSLNTLLTERAIQLSREDEASRLRLLHSAIAERLERVKRDESSASYGYNKARLVTSWGGLIAGVAIKMTSEDDNLSTFSNHLLKNLGGKRPPFGTVLVCIGPKGLPDDVEVVSISRLARESNREESDVAKELRMRGCILLSAEVFSLLIDKLIDGVLEGRLLLPISTEKLREIRTSSFFKPEAKKIKWVRCSRTP